MRESRRIFRPSIHGIVAGTDTGIGSRQRLRYAGDRSRRRERRRPRRRWGMNDTIR